jgi:hypothetical protein
MLAGAARFAAQSRPAAAARGRRSELECSETKSTPRPSAASGLRRTARPRRSFRSARSDQRNSDAVHTHHDC